MKLLKKLTQAASPSGNEEVIREVIKNEILSLADDITVDSLGNLIAHINGDGPRLMLDAHMDEIGIIVTYIEDNGFIRFSNLGGVVLNAAHSQRVRFLNGTTGVVYREQNKNQKEIKLSELFIDIGAKDREEAEEKIKVGDVAVFVGAFEETDAKIISKALDDRAGCYILIETMKRIKAHRNDLYFVFSVSEELGLRGAKAVSYTVKPDFAIAVDVTRTGDLPDETKMSVKLGGGAAIKVKDNSVLCHPKIKTVLEETAKENGILYQFEVLENGGTNTGAIHVSNGGVPSGCISIPTRYIHTPCEMIDKSDLEYAIKLLTKVIERGVE